MNKKLNLISFVIVTCLAVAPAAAQPTGTLGKIKSSGAIQLGGRDASFPFSYLTGGAEPVGFSAELCLKVVDAAKAKLNLPELKVQYTMVTPTNRIALLQNGTIDLECSTTTNTEARGQQVDFAPTHFVSGVAAVVKKSAGISSFAELEGKTVATASGSTSIQLLRAYRRSEKAEFAEISGKDITDTFLQFTSGRAAAMILDDVQLAGLIATAPNPGDYMILKERLRYEPYGFMVRKNDAEFKAVVDQTLSRLMSTGEINGIYAKWFMQPVPPKGVTLNFPMTDAIREAYKNPNNKGV